MRTPKLSAVFLAVVVLLFVIGFGIAQTPSDDIELAQTEIIRAYDAIVQADGLAANITVLTEQLNLAINLNSQARKLVLDDPQEAQNYALQAHSLAQNVATQAASARNEDAFKQPFMVVIVVALLVAMGVFVYRFGPTVFWKGWLWLRRGHHVKTRNEVSRNRGFILTIKQICALVLGVMVLLAFFVASPLIFPKIAGEAFSELGLLGAGMQLADYPSNIVSGETVSLHVYVGNQMGIPVYYSVLVKLGDNSTVRPAPVVPVQQYSNVVLNSGNWTFPIEVTLLEPGLNQRVIAELWMYNQTLGANQYHDRSVWVNLNVTAPAT